MRIQGGSEERPSLVPALLVFFLSVLFMGVQTAPIAAAPVRLASDAFPLPVEIEVRNLPAVEAEKAIRKALREIAALEALTSPTGSDADSLGALNRSPDAGITVDARLLRLLARARDFCIWSRGAFGPVAGELYSLWGLHRPVAARPTPTALGRATSRDCRNLLLNAETALARRPTNSIVDLWGFTEGFAVDVAMETLQAEGATDAVVEIGPFVRAIGGGPDGRRGWPVQLDSYAGSPGSIEAVWLTDQSFAFVHRRHTPVSIAGDSYAPFIDQRDGQPATNVRGTIVLTELAVDAQALAVSLSILGPREGQLRLSGLKPVPAVLWLLGEGVDGPPLLTTSHWSLAKTSSRRPQQ